MKKFLAMLLALVMVASLAACGGDTGESEQPSTQPTASEGAQESEPAAPVDAEPISYTPILHLDFETTDGLTAVHQVENDGSVAPSATYAIAGSNHPITLAEGQGAAGNALYLDGKYGVDFDMPEIADDIYTISFWYNADRVATFGPVVQLGRNIAWSNEPADTRDRTTTWMNFTKSTWGDNSADIFPVVWNRNSSIGTEVAEGGVNPWLYAMDNLEHGKREWCMVTVVLNGTRYIADDGMERIETQLYLDGELKWEANSENMYYQGIAPELFKGDNLEGHIGINYWDTTYKGFIDEFYIYHEALTPGQVKTLFELGNPPATPVAPETPDYAEEGGAAEDPSTLTVGGFFSSKTDFTALKNGETLTYTFTNTSNGSANWENYVMAVVTADANTYEGAGQEVMVIRADAWGWGGGASDFVAPDGEGNKLAFESDADFEGPFEAMMQAGAEVKITVSLDGNTLSYTANIGDNTISMTATSGVDLPDTLYVFLTGENCKLTNIAVA